MKTYCINLDERPEKWEQAQKEAKRLGLDPVRYAAYKTERGYDGCRISHLGVLSAVEEQVFMIIEDDIKIHCKHPKEALQKALSQLPHNWDMLYLGSTLNKPLTKHSENLYRIKKGWTTHGIIYNNQNGVVDFILNQQGIRKIDVFYADVVQERFNCYITYPMILTQREGYSDVVNKNVDYKVIEMRYKKYTQGYWCDNCHDETKEGCEHCKEDAWWLYV